MRFLSALTAFAAIAILASTFPADGAQVFTNKALEQYGVSQSPDPTPAAPVTPALEATPSAHPDYPEVGMLERGEALEKIKEECAKVHRTSYRFRYICIEKETQSYDNLAARMKMVAPDVFLKCQEEHMDSYRMMESCIDSTSKIKGKP